MKNNKFVSKSLFFTFIADIFSWVAINSIRLINKLVLLAIVHCVYEVCIQGGERACYQRRLDGRGKKREWVSVAAPSDQTKQKPSGYIFFFVFFVGPVTRHPFRLIPKPPPRWVCTHMCLCNALPALYNPFSPIRRFEHSVHSTAATAIASYIMTAGPISTAPRGSKLRCELKHAYIHTYIHLYCTYPILVKTWLCVPLVARADNVQAVVASHNCVYSRNRLRKSLPQPEVRKTLSYTCTRDYQKYQWF